MEFRVDTSSDEVRRFVERDTPQIKVTTGSYAHFWVRSLPILIKLQILETFLPIHRALSDEPDPGDLMRPFPANPMRMWPISTRVNKPENDDPTIVDPVELTA